MKQIQRVNKVEHIKQLLNFVDKECEEYDVSEIQNSILVINGNDKSRLLNIKLFIQLDAKKEILNFFDNKKYKSGIKKRMIMILNSLLTNKRDKSFYEIESKVSISGETVSIGAMKFHSQDNVRVICREYDRINCISIVMIEACKKKGEKNNDDGNYNNRLKAAEKTRHYYKDKLTGKKIYL